MSCLVTAAAARTFLFVPGDQGTRWTRAVDTGADVVIVDLEDAVAPARKALARTALAESSIRGLATRVNAPDTPWFHADLEILQSRPWIVMLPKAEDPDVVDAVGAALPHGSVLVALIETSRGVLAAPEIARVPYVGRLALGTFDLGAELGVDPDQRTTMDTARVQLSLASAAAGLSAPIDGVTGDVHDEQQLRDDVSHARRLGLTGKLCIHPAQVDISAEAFTPDQKELEAARRVISAWEPQDHGVLVLDGRMVDAPVVARARRILDAVRERPRMAP